MVKRNVCIYLYLNSLANNLLLYVFLNLNFKLRQIDFYYLGPIVSTILTLNLKVNLKCINKISFK